MILKAFAAVRQVLSNSFLGRGTSWAWRAEDVGRFDGEEKLRAGEPARGGVQAQTWLSPETRARKQTSRRRRAADRTEVSACFREELLHPSSPKV